MPGLLPPSGPLRTRVYVDGYNFYYGCLKGTAYKWLDLLALFEKQILPSALLKNESGNTPYGSLLVNPGLKFFTAKILEKVAKTPDSVSSQARYHTALAKYYKGRVEVIEGYYAVNKMKVRIVDAENPDQPPRDCQEIQAWKVEEKQSDVNLALHAYHDALTGVIDHAVIVTNDTDIVPALRMIQEHTDVKIGIVVPTSDHQRIPNTSLAELAHWVRTHITHAELAACQLPRVIQGRRPTIKPESWYARPDLLRQVLNLAIPIRGGEGNAFKWMNSPNEYLDGNCPIDLVDTEEGAKQVLDYIYAWIAQQNEKLH